MEEGQVHSSHTGEEEISALDLLLTLTENWRTLVIAPIAVSLLTLGVSFLIPPIYTASTRILPPPQQQSISAALAAQLGFLAGLVGSTGALKNPADQYVALLQSRSVLDAIVRRFDLRKLYDVRHIEDARKELAKRTLLSSGLRDGLILIEVEDRNPMRAAAMANAYVDELRTLTSTLAITEAGQRRLFFEEQLSQAKENLNRSEIALQASGVGEAVLRTVPQSVLDSLARLKAQITAQEIKIQSLRTFMTDANPEFRLAVRQLAALYDEVSKTEQNRPRKANEKGTEYVAKYRDFKYHEALFELMAKQYELARLDEAREGAIVQVVDTAVPPERRSRPKRGLMTLIASMTALVLALLFVLLRQSIRNSVHEPGANAKLARLRALLGHYSGDPSKL